MVNPYHVGKASQNVKMHITPKVLGEFDTHQLLGYIGRNFRFLMIYDHMKRGNTILPPSSHTRQKGIPKFGEGYTISEDPYCRRVEISTQETDPKGFI